MNGRRPRTLNKSKLIEPDQQAAAHDLFADVLGGHVYHFRLDEMHLDADQAVVLLPT